MLPAVDELIVLKVVGAKALLTAPISTLLYTHFTARITSSLCI
jgi:hypothetical protein